ncbi:MAG: lipoprotein [Escherichia coli]|nr:lipoprotein [Escherichia coli]
MKKILLVAGAALALAGCGEKGDFEKAINAKIGQDKYCFSLDNNNTSFPIRLAKPRLDSTGTGTNSVILDGFVEQGMMVFEQGYDSNVLGITEECVGRRAVDEIKEWTEPGNGNQKVVRVTYTWKLVDVPGWIDKKAFTSVKGMNEPADGAMNLVKTSNGWRAN